MNLARPLRPATGRSVVAWRAWSRDALLGDAGHDLVETLADRPHAVPGALRRFGRSLGADGWAIERVVAWIDDLRRVLPRRHRRAVGRPGALRQLVLGWAEGFVEGAHAGMCIDPITGLVTPAVLRQRLEEIYARCARAEVAANDVHGTVLVDLDLTHSEGLLRDLVMACAADIVAQVFATGETVARAGDRIVVVARRSLTTERRVDELAERLQADAGTRPARPMVLTDDLPASPGDLDAYVRDLSGGRR